jgi:cytochrome c-type biogenesis protein CcmH
MKNAIRRSVISLLIFFVLGISALYAVQIEFHKFKNSQQEQLYVQMIAELRCVQCQNQNLAESNAELAGDMREKVYEIVTKGGSREDVIDYMTARYGDFVLYNPPFKSETLLLWLGPAVFLLLSLMLLFKLIRSQKNKPKQSFSEADRNSVRDLLTSNSKK